MKFDIEKMCLAKLEKLVDENSEVWLDIIRKSGNCDKCHETLSNAYNFINEVRAIVSIYKEGEELKKQLNDLAATELQKNKKVQSSLW